MRQCAHLFFVPLCWAADTYRQKVENQWDVISQGQQSDATLFLYMPLRNVNTQPHSKGTFIAFRCSQEVPVMEIIRGPADPKSAPDLVLLWLFQTGQCLSISRLLRFSHSLQCSVQKKKCIVCVCCWILQTNNLSHWLCKVGLNAGLSTVWGSSIQVWVCVCLYAAKKQPCSQCGTKGFTRQPLHYPLSCCFTSSDSGFCHDAVLDGFMYM